MAEVSLWELVLRWMSLDLTDDKSTLVQVMAKAITWAKGDPDLCRHMASLGPNGLKWDADYKAMKLLITQM